MHTGLGAALLYICSLLLGFCFVWLLRIRLDKKEAKRLVKIKDNLEVGK